MQESELQARKKSHLALCETDEAAFKVKTCGFEHYDFMHYAITEIDLQSITLQKDFFGFPVASPLLISCMTGGVAEADNINLQLAEAASELQIPLGLGSLRYALGNQSHDDNLREISSKKGNAPLMANIGAAQLVLSSPGFTDLLRIADVLEPDVFVVHINPLQELLQKNGEPSFTGLLHAMDQFCSVISCPVIVKEVGSGISKSAAASLLQCGVQGIDTAGAGGTSWAGVEILRNGDKVGNEFWDWGIPTAYSIKTIAKLKKKNDFVLIGSGGINSAFDAAKALALGADFVGSARIFFHAFKKNGVQGVIDTVQNWNDTIKKIMFLTGAASYGEFNRKVLIEKKDFH